MATTRYVLITGCSPGGIGHALCIAFHAKGFCVIATARKPSVLADLADKGMTCLALDVTNQASIDTCHAEVVKITGGKLDILVNNAGVPLTYPALDLDLNRVRQVFETNVYGVMAMTKAFVPLLISTKGLIINVSSSASKVPLMFGSAYAASKGAVDSYSRCLRQELRPFGVRVMVAWPSLVKSNMTMPSNENPEEAKARTEEAKLPEDSLYRVVNDIWENRGSALRSIKYVSPEEYADQLVGETLKSERPSWLRNLVGRPDWTWGGHMGKTMGWVVSLGGTWLVENMAYKTFKLNVMEERLKAQKAM